MFGNFRHWRRAVELKRKLTLAKEAIRHEVRTMRGQWKAKYTKSRKRVHFPSQWMEATRLSATHLGAQEW